MSFCTGVVRSIVVESCFFDKRKENDKCVHMFALEGMTPAAKR